MGNILICFKVQLQEDITRYNRP